MKSFRKACRGEKGFTLIELLVVIMILGVLAAVVTLAVTKFIGKGTVESANAECVTVQSAIEACLADAGYGEFDAPEPAFDGTQGTSPSVTVDNTTIYYVSDYLRQNSLKAEYAIAVDGDITGATDTGWGNLTFNATTQKWSKTP